MSDQRRVLRVEKELQQLTAQFISKDLRGFLKGLVSVTRVESNPKLRTAKVFVTVLGQESDRQESLQVLADSTQDIQNFINKQLRMKFVPRVSIHLDMGFEKMLKVESLLRQIATSETAPSNQKSSEAGAEGNSTDEDSF